LPVNTKYLRFEIGTDRPLKDIVFAQIERFLKRKGDFKFKFEDSNSWKSLIQQMMAEFEESSQTSFSLLS
jgi:hypothetical protein